MVNFSVTVFSESYEKQHKWIKCTFAPYQQVNSWVHIKHASAHISSYRGTWWLATLHHMAADDGGNMAE